MSPQQQDYLTEHLPYILQMLRFTHNYLMTHSDGLKWNAYYEAFAVSARNLDRFLSNSDGNNFKAREFVNSHQKNKTRKLAAEGIFSRIGNQVFHFGKKRPTGTVGKVNSHEIDTVYKWLEAEIVKFFDALSAEQRSLWNLQIADPHKPNALISIAGPTTSQSYSATNAVYVTGPYRESS